jgi:hypothetical protein
MKLSKEAINAAIQDIVAGEVGEPVLVTKFVVVCETVLAESGVRMLSRLPSEDATPWDIHGMLSLVAADTAEDFIVATNPGRYFEDLEE